MGSRIRGAIFVLSVVTVAAVGVLGVSALRAPERPDWPDRIAVIGLDESDAAQPVRYLAVADPVRQAVVEVPVDAVIEIPASGFLRAYHAHRLGGPPRVRASLERLFGVEVPFSVWGPGAHFEGVAAAFTEAEILPEHVDDLRATLEQAAGWERHTLTGEEKPGPRGAYLILDQAAVSAAARAIGGLGTRVFVDPTQEEPLVPTSPPDPQAAPAPTPMPIPPSEIAVEVLNGGEVRMAATQTAERLEEAGYRIARVGDFTPQDRETSFVYFRADDADSEAKAIVVAQELGYPVEALPDGISMRAASDVLVILGHDAQV